MRFLKISSIIAMLILATGCTRIETGTTGIRINASKQIEGAELLPGSFNQIMVGDVLIFPTKDIVVSIENKTPLTAENTPLSDFDLSIVYGVSPSSVAEIWSTKSRSFHATQDDGDILLMYTYMNTIVNNAAYKVVRQYKNLEVADNRAKIEVEIQELVNKQLADEKLDSAISLSVVQVRNVQPNAEILKSATEYVRSLNELKTKENEIKIAEAESKRQQALSNNGPAAIEYMRAQATLIVANAIADGKVNTIIIPSDTNAILNLGK